MKIANNNILKLAFVFSITVCSYSHAGWFFNKQIDKTLDGLEKVGTKLTNQLTEAGTVVGSEAGKAVATALPEVGVKPAEILVDGGKELSTMWAPIADKCAMALGVFSCIYAVGKVYEIGKDINSHLNPSEEQRQQQKANILMARSVERELKSKIDLEDCFIANHHREKNRWGRPTACEHLAETFGTVWGRDKLDDKTKDFIRIFVEKK
jgi:hypothetical protein